MASDDMKKLTLLVDGMDTLTIMIVTKRCNHDIIFHAPPPYCR